MIAQDEYFMESKEETIRLEIKTDPEKVRAQALWCGVKPGMRILDAGCGPGITTHFLAKIVESEGRILGLDYSSERIRYARMKYGQYPNITFSMHDLRKPLNSFGTFDLAWARFVLEYNRKESFDMVANMTACLKPGGYMCLMDLDYNCLTHFELPPRMEQMLLRLSRKVEVEYNYDPYVGRKLYSFLYDLGYEEIEIDVRPHHLLYGTVDESDMFNWVKKVETATNIGRELFDNYPGQKDGFFEEFRRFFKDPRRFTYTPLIMCKGTKPGRNRFS